MNKIKLKTTKFQMLTIIGIILGTGSLAMVSIKILSIIAVVAIVSGIYVLLKTIVKYTAYGFKSLLGF